ncbi:hypothetical protein GOV03_01305 [Candidatus Woesearchaeota archaeon]|nr:hypothetical protein [Candidatus Woesearchaeota archaeon]
MKEVVKKEILELLSKTISILEVKEPKDVEELKALSNHAVEGVALHKDLDMISVTVLVYSLYKIAKNMTPQDCQGVLKDLRMAKTSLEQGNLGKYNHGIKLLYSLVRKCNAKVKEHLQDVMQAAKIKKGTVLLQKGLSLGQAAGLMGLSNWDLQQYAGKTMVIETHHEAVPAKKRMATALKIFNIQNGK